MGWVAEANRLGEYRSSYGGFRVYVVKEGSMESRIDEMEDGIYRVTDFVRPDFLAVCKNGDIIESNSIEELGFEIDFYNFL